MQEEETQQSSAVHFTVEPHPGQDVSHRSFHLGSWTPLWSFFRVNSPLLVPLILFLIFFSFIFVLNLRGFIHIPWTGILPLAFIMASIGIIQAASLLYAPNDTLWAAAVAGGFFLFLSITMVAFMGWKLGLLIVMLLLIAIILVLRSRFHTVSERTVQAMVLFGKYNRTLYPGLNFCFPGERVMAILPTSESFYTCSPQRIYVTSSNTEIEMSATISYQLVPDLAHLAVLNIDDWEKRLAHCLEMVLQDAVNAVIPEDFLYKSETFAGSILAGTELAPISWNTLIERMNTRAAASVQQQVKSWGIQVNWVKVHDFVVLDDGREPQKSVPREEHQNDEVAEPVLAPQAEMPASPFTSGDLPLSQTGENEKNNTEESNISVNFPNQGVPVQGMVETYQAVRDGRIRNITTIRTLARAFDAFAGEKGTEEDLPFDFVEAAENLRRHATSLDSTSRRA